VNERTAAPVREHDSAAVVAFDTVVAEVAKDGALRFAPRQPGPPPRVDGHLLALTSLERPPPHLGERHPDCGASARVAFCDQRKSRSRVVECRVG
jgi:hypothetical protein